MDNKGTANARLSVSKPSNMWGVGNIWQIAQANAGRSRPGYAAADAEPQPCFLTSLAQASLSVTVRLKTGLPGTESVSVQK